MEELGKWAALAKCPHLQPFLGGSQSIPMYGYSDTGRAHTCSLMVLIPSGPRRDTACFTRSVRPQFSIRKPRSCLNLASMATASSFREAQKQSSALRKEETVRKGQRLHRGLVLGEHRLRKHQADFPSAVHVTCSFLGSSSWIRAWQLTPVYLLGETHGQKSLWATVHGSQRVRHN